METTRPDLILMDIDLAGEMDGIEAADRIFSKYAVPIVFITANDSEHIVRRASSTEPFGYILKPFTERELRVSIEMAFHKEKNLKIQQEFTTKIERLHHLALEMSAQEREEKICELTVLSAVKLLDFQYLGFYLKYRNELVDISDKMNAFSEKAISNDFIMSLARKTFALKKKIIFRSLADLTGFFVSRSGDIKSGISLPIGEFGVFQVFSIFENFFGKNEFSLLELLINHTAESLKRIQLQRELMVQAMHDPLTKVYNRFYLFQELERFYSYTRRYKRPVAFLMIDVNDLKHINDHYGHQVGDEVLKTVANLLREGARDVDTIVRYGGDEFLIMLPETGPQVEIVKKRILKRAEEWNQSDNAFKFPVTFAIGTAFWDTNGKETLEEILTRADVAMYKNKRELKRKSARNYFLSRKRRHSGEKADNSNS